MPLRLGTRGSVLARWQSDWCAARLREAGHDVETIVIQTRGDRVQEGPIANLGAQGVFTKEIQQALLCREIDLAVHSLKDLPTETVEGLSLAAVPRRGAYRDAFLCHSADSPEHLPEGARIGTGSLRRKTQLVHRYGNRFRIEEIRGNIETRIKKMDEGTYDAIVLAEAALIRLGLADRIRSFLQPPEFLPAVGQGALGLEIRSDDFETQAILDSLCDRETFLSVLAERALLRTLKGGCIAPIGSLARVENGLLVLHGRILSLDGLTMFESIQSAPISSDPEALGRAVAGAIVEQGGDEILKTIQQLRTA